MDINEIKEYKRFIKVLVHESENIINQSFRKPVDIQLKKDNTPVTVVDKWVEELLRQMIMETYPDHGILGEEYGMHNQNSEYQWILDPIDGTKSFICGAATFGTLIGLTYKGEPILGALNLPVLKQFIIGDNFITKLNGKPTLIRKCSSVSNAVLLATDDKIFFNDTTNSNFLKLLEKVGMYRFYGDCYGYYLLVSGFADIMYDPKMSPWDIIPLIPIIKGAGGLISGHDGSTAKSAKNAIASSPEIHDDIIDLLTVSNSDTYSA